MINEFILFGLILVAIIYFVYSAKKKLLNNKQNRINKINANAFINGMSEENSHDIYASRTFTRGFTAAKAEDGSYLFIKQAKLTDGGLFY